MISDATTLTYAAAVGDISWNAVLRTLSETMGGAALFVFEGDLGDPASFKGIASYGDDRPWGDQRFDVFVGAMLVQLAPTLHARIGAPFDPRGLGSAGDAVQDGLLRCIVLQSATGAPQAATTGPVAGAWLGLPCTARRVMACTRSPTSAKLQDETLHLPRPSGLPPLAVTFLPAPDSAGAVATVLVDDPAAGPALPCPESLRRRFGLTVAEARVVRLVPLALSKRQMAARLGVSENTVRSQLAAARAKAGARNMRELADVIARVGVRATH